MNVNIIGAGAVGKTLGRLMVHHHLASIQGIVNQNITSAQKAIDFIGQGQAFASLQELPKATIIFITTPDDCIETTAYNYSKTTDVNGHIVVHCSGALNSDALKSLKERGAWIASIHPMMSFAKPNKAVEHFHGTFCAMEGDEEALHVLEPLFKAMGAKTYGILKDKKMLYHAAGVFASNYVVTLIEEASACLTLAGIEDTISRNIIEHLVNSTITNIAHATSPIKALTGPLARGDVGVVQQHLDALLPSQQALYRQLGQATLEKVPLEPAIWEAMHRLLTQTNLTK